MPIEIINQSPNFSSDSILPVHMATQAFEKVINQVSQPASVDELVSDLVLNYEEPLLFEWLKNIFESVVASKGELSPALREKMESIYATGDTNSAIIFANAYRLAHPLENKEVAETLKETLLDLITQKPQLALIDYTRQTINVEEINSEMSQDFEAGMTYSYLAVAGLLALTTATFFALTKTSTSPSRSFPQQPTCQKKSFPNLHPMCFIDSTYNTTNRYQLLVIPKKERVVIDFNKLVRKERVDGHMVHQNNPKKIVEEKKKENKKTAFEILQKRFWLYAYYLKVKYVD